jgi:hypothetical protein
VDRSKDGNSLRFERIPTEGGAREPVRA